MKLFYLTILLLFRNRKIFLVLLSIERKVQETQKINEFLVTKLIRK